MDFVMLLHNWKTPLFYYKAMKWLLKLGKKHIYLKGDAHKSEEII